MTLLVICSTWRRLRWDENFDFTDLRRFCDAHTGGFRCNQNHLVVPLDKFPRGIPELAIGYGFHLDVSRAVGGLTFKTPLSLLAVSLHCDAACLSAELASSSRMGVVMRHAPGSGGGWTQAGRRHQLGSVGGSSSLRGGRLDVECRAECLILNEEVDELSLIHISEPTRLLSISYAVFCLKKKKKKKIPLL
eukprot:TRINITY_DN295_c0_g1_i6.p1 TRINITY_DN295_c0_g1~~TRINITY_DN295_c0_g1_i6.p1  ORF type:complete len:191 (+),score=30.54 TRINITY_DN295_c0_g1_i6:491-1063(+)